MSEGYIISFLEEVYMEVAEDVLIKLLGLDKCSTYGNYKVYGISIFISSIEGPKMKSQLYYHCDKNQFYLVKNYLVSNKCHIDFFDRIDNEETIYSPNNTRNTDAIIEIGECHYDDHSKYLKYNPQKEAYVLSSMKENMSFETILYYGRSVGNE